MSSLFMSFWSIWRSWKVAFMILFWLLSFLIPWNSFKLTTSLLWTIFRKVKDQVKTYIAEHFEIDPDGLYFTHPTFFSRLENKPAKNVHDEYWHVHVDKETYQTFHYTSLLYLTDMGEDFQVKQDQRNLRNPTA